MIYEYITEKDNKYNEKSIQESMQDILKYNSDFAQEKIKKIIDQVKNDIDDMNDSEFKTIGKINAEANQLLLKLEYNNKDTEIKYNNKNSEVKIYRDFGSLVNPKYTTLKEFKDANKCITDNSGNSSSKYIITINTTKTLETCMKIYVDNSIDDFDVIYKSLKQRLKELQKASSDLERETKVLTGSLIKDTIRANKAKIDDKKNFRSISSNLNMYKWNPAISEVDEYQEYINEIENAIDLYISSYRKMINLANKYV